jgi:hypothetical protein
LKLEKALKFMKADASRLNPALSSAEVTSFLIDSREVQAGALFLRFLSPSIKTTALTAILTIRRNMPPPRWKMGRSPPSCVPTASKSGAPNWENSRTV